MGRIWTRFAVGLLLPGFLLSGCGGKKDPTQLLVVYSGDCQGYIEPCG